MDLIELENLEKEISLARRELKNIRQEVFKQGYKFRSEYEAIKKLMLRDTHEEKKKEVINDNNDNSFNMVPVGVISSCFKNKNGIPRQPSLCQSAKATLEINKTYFTNPEHSLVGLSEFSYIWVLFVFNKNNPCSSGKSKVRPPRLNGVSAGVFSTRSPHRPCPIGISLVKLDKIIGSTLFLSGVDMLDGTPVLDIKPYLPSYDTPKFDQDDSATAKKKSTEHLSNSEHKNDSSNVISIIPEFEVLNSCTQDKNIEKCQDDDSFQKNSESSVIGELLKMPSTHLEVVFTTRAEKDIEKFHSQNHNLKCNYCLDFIPGPIEAKQGIIEILQNDPRSIYRKNKCSDKLYFFTIDNLHITSWFDDSVVEVLRIKPIKEM